MYADGYIVGDGSWDLKIYVTDLKVERILRVKGDLHIGGVMFKLVEDLDVAVDWSDHGLWWPKKNIWLSRTRSTLDQYGVQADAILHFTPMHKILRIQLSDLRYVDTKVDLSVKCFSAVKELCKEWGIRHPEELSFARPLGPEHLKKNCRIMSATSRQRLRETITHPPAKNIGPDGFPVEEGGIYGRNISTPGPIFNQPYMSGVSSPDGKSTPGIIDERTRTPLIGQTEGIGGGTSPLWTTIPKRPERKKQHEQINGTIRSLGGKPQQQPPQLQSTISLYPYGSSSPIIQQTTLPHYLQQSMTPTITAPGLDPYGNMMSELSLTVPNLSSSPSVIPAESRNGLLRPKNLVEKARLNASWLDSSLSLYEQDVREFDTLLLRFKFFSFYDLNPKVDAARINEIYEQARWALLTEEVDCTENEAMMFAALQLQVRNASRTESGREGEEVTNNRYHRSKSNEDEIESALNELQAQLEGSFTVNGGSSNPSSPFTYHRPTSRGDGEKIGLHQFSGEIIHVPELSDYLRFSKPRRFTLKTTKKLYFVFRDTQLSAFKTREDRFGPPSFVINLRGCEITPDVNLSQLRYAMKLEVPQQQEGMVEYNLRFSSEDQYAKWLAAFRLASKGKSMADSAYDNEVRQILDFLSIQHPAPLVSHVTSNVPSSDVNPDDFVCPKHLRKAKSRGYLVHRILEAHANVRDFSSLEAKLQLIKAWQNLPEYGVSLFVVRFAGSKKEELLGVSANKLMRLDINTGDHLKTWKYNSIKTWNVNWEVKQLKIDFDADEVDIQFSCLSADCKVVHEFIGGYIFLSMRSKEANQTLNEELFHKLTGGWI